MRVSLIAAMAQNRVIGRDNQLPWRLPADLQHFKKITMGKPIVMGRKTWQSIGRPLPGRTNIVITRDANFQAEGCVVVHSIDGAIQAADGNDELMIIGGANLYEQTLGQAERLYLTRIKADVEGDAWFPQLEDNKWKQVECESFTADAKNEYDYEFVVYERTT